MPVTKIVAFLLFFNICSSALFSATSSVETPPLLRLQPSDKDREHAITYFFNIFSPILQEKAVWLDDFANQSFDLPVVSSPIYFFRQQPNDQESFKEKSTKEIRKFSSNEERLKRWEQALQEVESLRVTFSADVTLMSGMTAAEAHFPVQSEIPEDATSRLRLPFVASGKGSPVISFRNPTAILEYDLVREQRTERQVIRAPIRNWPTIDFNASGHSPLEMTIEGALELNRKNEMPGIDIRIGQGVESTNGVRSNLSEAHLADEEVSEFLSALHDPKGENLKALLRVVVRTPPFRKLVALAEEELTDWLAKTKLPVRLWWEWSDGRAVQNAGFADEADARIDELKKSGKLITLLDSKLSSEVRAIDFIIDPETLSVRARLQAPAGLLVNLDLRYVDLRNPKIYSQISDPTLKSLLKPFQGMAQEVSGLPLHSLLDFKENNAEIVIPLSIEDGLPFWNIPSLTVKIPALETAEFTQAGIKGLNLDPRSQVPMTSQILAQPEEILKVLRSFLGPGSDSFFRNINAVVSRRTNAEISALGWTEPVQIRDPEISFDLKMSPTFKLVPRHDGETPFECYFDDQVPDDVYQQLDFAESPRLPEAYREFRHMNAKITKVCRFDLPPEFSFSLKNVKIASGKRVDEIIVRLKSKKGTVERLVAKAKYVIDPATSLPIVIPEKVNLSELFAGYDFQVEGSGIHGKGLLKGTIPDLLEGFGLGLWNGDQNFPPPEFGKSIYGLVQRRKRKELQETVETGWAANGVSNRIQQVLISHILEMMNGDLEFRLASLRSSDEIPLDSRDVQKKLGILGMIEQGIQSGFLKMEPYVPLGRELGEFVIPATGESANVYAERVVKEIFQNTLSGEAGLNEEQKKLSIRGFPLALTNEEIRRRYLEEFHPFLKARIKGLLAEQAEGIHSYVETELLGNLANSAFQEFLFPKAADEKGLPLLLRDPSKFGESNPPELPSPINLPKDIHQICVPPQTSASILDEFVVRLGSKRMNQTLYPSDIPEVFPDWEDLPGWMKNDPRSKIMASTGVIQELFDLNRTEIEKIISEKIRNEGRAVMKEDFAVTFTPNHDFEINAQNQIVMNAEFHIHQKAKSPLNQFDTKAKGVPIRVQFGFELLLRNTTTNDRKPTLAISMRPVTFDVLNEEEFVSSNPLEDIGNILEAIFGDGGFMNGAFVRNLKSSVMTMGTQDSISFPAPSFRWGDRSTPDVSLKVAGVAFVRDAKGRQAIAFILDPLWHTDVSTRRSLQWRRQDNSLVSRPSK